ncbi:GNAT family N-acetyltransferase [Pareuzebyella sediminis]|uniref:GNAT family N-acetyltransferase n=1 Tax=Pareuzebyella sediminis TaxID=2607998 RepID=UPI0011ECAAE4|nr:GNAT family N-acetyltransferase [Pareuzebyella sediminis]
MEIRSMQAQDWVKVSEIYAEGIATGFATFETTVPPYETWDKAHLKSCRLVAIDDPHVLGWAALSPVSSRCVYGGVAEISVYVSKNHRGRGVGKALLETLIALSEKEGFWTLQSGVFPENQGSIALHYKMGFRHIGKRERIGKLDGVWKDNLLFERRSTTVGID